MTDSAAFLNRPPADTAVLTGYGKNWQQLEWIHREKHLELWRIEGQPLLLSKDHLRRTGYPNPSADVYICFRLVPVDGAGPVTGLSREVIRQIQESEWRARHPSREEPGRTAGPHDLVSPDDGKCQPRLTSSRKL